MSQKNLKNISNKTSLPPSHCLLAEILQPRMPRHGKLSLSRHPKVHTHKWLVHWDQTMTYFSPTVNLKYTSSLRGAPSTMYQEAADQHSQLLQSVTEKKSSSAKKKTWWRVTEAFIYDEYLRNKTEVCRGFLRIIVHFLMIHVQRTVKEVNRYTVFKGKWNVRYFFFFFFFPN